MPRILVVEDSRTQAEQLRLILQAEGFEVEVAPDGQTAWDVLGTAAFDVVISDILMPVLSGYELCRKVKDDPARRNLPVILLTNLTEPMDIIQGLECGADNFLTKPCEPSYLISRIRTILDSKARRTAGTLTVGAEVVFQGKRVTINSEKEQILNLLVATFEDVLRTNRELRTTQAELKEAKAKVDQYAGQLEYRVRSVEDMYKQANEALKASEEQFRRLVDGIKDYALYMLDPEGHVATWNVGAERIKGYQAAEIIGKHFSIFYPAEDVARGRPGQDLQQALAEGRYEDEGWRILKDGSRFFANIVITPLRSNAGQHIGFAKIIRDVTDRKKLEEQLRQAQKMEAIGQLAGGVAHDFNNLLTVISGYSELLLKGLSSNDPSRNLLHEIYRAGERAASLTRQLLAFSRKQVLEPRVLDLNAVVTETEKMLRRLIGEDITVTTVLHPGLEAVKADPGQIEQILINLAVNARDAMPEGGKLTIETANVDLDETYAQTRPAVKPGRYVMLAMSDTGCGMDEATQTHIFEPFFTTKGPGKGTGLGLATVYGIVKQSGGHIYVYSEPDKGATFKLYLPVVKERVPTGKSLPGLKFAPPGTETILLVEDDEVVRSLARQVLQMYGYAVLEARDGEEGIRLWQAHRGPIRLLITDVVMPKMGGRQVAARLAQLQPGLKVLYVSGYTDDAVVRHGVLEGEFAFLQKPYTPFALATKVRQVLDK